MILFNTKKPINNISIQERLKGSIFGFIVADALGVPVEFMSRESLKMQKINDMEEYGTHNQPKGTWSDDSSMLLATIDGLIKSNNEIDYQLIMNNFIDWQKKGKFTPFNHVFDIGIATNNALAKYWQNINNNEPENVICGTGEISSNGNGSLMRILPISIYLYLNNIDYKDNKYYEIIKTISGMTHSHNYSILGCYIYSIYVSELLKCNDKSLAYKKLQEICSDIKIEGIEIYDRILKHDISKLKENEIKSTGYVLDTLEASMWCLLTTDSYKEAVLKAVNLGDDTDTVGAITGGLAGIIYGYNSIPLNWIECLQKKDYIKELIDNFIDKYLNKRIGNQVKENIDLKVIEETIDDLKNNPNACTLTNISSKPGVLPISDSQSDDVLKRFINYLYDNKLLNQKYLEDIKKCENKNIEDLTKDEVLTILTFIIRGERFSSGLLKSKFDDGSLLKLVQKLK